VIVPAAAWILGMIAAVPFVLWWARDFGRIPGRTWFWSGYDPRPWRWAVFLGFFLGGVVAIVTALRWRRSNTRDELLDELRERRAERAMRAPLRPPSANVHPFLPRVDVESEAATRRDRPGRRDPGAHGAAAGGAR
jgi:hypothetical protein